MAIIQGSPVERNIYLTLADVPVTGVLPTDVVCQYRKEGETSLTPKLLDSSNWVEIGSGFYFVKFSASEMDTLGYFFYTLSGVKFDNFLYDEFTIEPTPGVPPSPVPGICRIHGNVRTASADAARSKKITARPVSSPTKYGSNIITTDAVVSYVDSSGDFELPLVQGSIVIIEIESTGIRVQVTVPAATDVNFEDLVPDIWA